VNPWKFVRCRLLGKHHWEPVADSDLDTGWRCRDCGEEVLNRQTVERDYEPEEPSSPYWGKRQAPKP
jgi:hypothetical protein